MSLRPKVEMRLFRRDHHLHFYLFFRSKVLEENYTLCKLPQQKLFLKLISVFAILLCIVSWAMNQSDRPSSEPEFIAYRVTLLVILVAALLIQRYKDSYIEFILILLSTFSFLTLAESSKEEIEKWGTIPYIAAGMYMEILSLCLIIARIGWMKTLIFTLGINFLCWYRYVLFQENYGSKFYPLFHFIFNICFLNSLSFALEKIDRNHFYEDKKNEFSQNCFKELIRDVYPNPIVIIEGIKPLFANTQARKSFNCKTNEEILQHFDNLIIDLNNEEFFSSLEVISDKQNNPEPCEIRIFTKRDWINKKINEEDHHILSVKKNQSLLDLLKKSYKKSSSNQSYLRTLKGAYKFQDSDEICHYDVTIKNLVWEDKLAFMVLLSENKMIQKIQHLKDHSILKDNLLATVSHNLKTPLNGIIGMINDTIKQISDRKITKSLTVAYRSANHLLFMVNDILDYYQLTNGNLRLNLEYFSLWDLIQDCSKLIKYQAKLKGLGFIKENRISGSNRGGYMRNDSTRIKQVVLNLLGNALKFTPSGSISVILEEARIVSEAEDAHVGFQIKVSDTGLGIKKEDQANLFTFFSKNDSKKKDNENNRNGLGLAISQNLVKTLNDDIKDNLIKVSSDLGQGSCFWFPIVSRINSEYEENFDSQISEPERNEIFKNIGKKNNIPLEKETVNRGPIKILENQSALRILLVDDDQINILVAKTYLKCINNIEYDVSTNGLKAIEKIKQEAQKNNYYDIILMDCNMPVLDGFEATIEIRELIQNKVLPDIYIIACTANASDNDYNYCFQVGMNDYLAKPFSRKDLISKLRKFKEKSKMHVELNLN